MLTRACGGASTVTVVFYCLKRNFEKNIWQMLNVLRQRAGCMGTLLLCSYTL